MHGTLVAGLALCTVASYVEWSRALDGHAVAWVYAFEWPLFAVLGTGMWWRLVRSEAAGNTPLEVKVRRPPRAADISADDPELIAWQAYLQRLHAEDPPGGPPT